ncbi:unnamed protein product [Lactuca virosa]|uniref:Uncharacterized protein n=1 Tax=Lactuca virosa TaxID=75947 RepID=A0AAU9PNG9_9ASTR|nr:unnamed protein product [Lactuca virosa]
MEVRRRLAAVMEEKNVWGSCETHPKRRDRRPSHRRLPSAAIPTVDTAQADLASRFWSCIDMPIFPNPFASLSLLCAHEVDITFVFGIGIGVAVQDIKIPSVLSLHCYSSIWFSCSFQFKQFPIDPSVELNANNFQFIRETICNDEGFECRTEEE